MTPPATIARLYELLADQAVGPLADAEGAELERLLAKWPHVDPDSFRLAAAAIDLALAPPTEAPPARLVAAVEADAAAFFATSPDRRAAFRARPSDPAPRRRACALLWAASGWAVAAAVVVAAGVPLLRPAAATTTAERREQLRASAARFAAAPALPGRPAAEVLWSQGAQRGFLEVSGLPPNDPARTQYQLWVIDAGRAGQASDRVDAGVFDVGPDGRALVEVAPTLRVFRAAAFAVTEEAPGGVVVSDVPARLRVALAPVR